MSHFFAQRPVVFRLCTSTLFSPLPVQRVKAQGIGRHSLWKLENNLLHTSPSNRVDIMGVDLP